MPKILFPTIPVRLPKRLGKGTARKNSMRKSLSNIQRITFKPYKKLEKVFQRESPKTL